MATNRPENTPEKTNRVGVDEHMVVSFLVEGQLMVFTIERENGSGAYTREAFLEKPTDLFGQEDLHVVGAFDMHDHKDERITLNSKSKYAKTAILCALSEEDKEPAVTASTIGNAVAVHFQKNTTPKKWGDKPAKPMTCNYAYLPRRQALPACVPIYFRCSAHSDIKVSFAEYSMTILQSNDVAVAVYCMLYQPQQQYC